MKQNKLIWVVVIIAGLMLAYILFGAGKVGAVAVDKITWCHTEPNGNQQTLELPQAALEQAGHVDANGNPLHAGDHAGECIEVTPTEEVTPTDEPSVTPEPDFTPSPTSGESAGLGGPGDGRSDGKSSCPECTAAPKTVVPEGPPATGRAS